MNSLKEYCPLCSKDLSSFKTIIKKIFDLKIFFLKRNFIHYSCKECELNLSVCKISNDFNIASYHEYDEVNKEYSYYYIDSFTPHLAYIYNIDGFSSKYKDLMHLDKDISLKEAAKVIKTYKDNLLFL